MKGKTIAIVANATWNIYKFRLNLIKKLLDSNHRVIVIAPLDEFISYKEKFPAVKHIPLRQLSRKHTNPLKDIKLVFELRAIYKRLKPDLIVHYTHKANIYGGFAAGLSRQRSIGVVTGLGYAFLHKGLINLFTRLMYRIVKRVHKRIVFENEDDMNVFVEMGLAGEKQVAYVNGCGVDTAVYLPVEKNEEGPVIFTFIGRLLYDKGIREFVSAAEIIKKQNPEIEFWVIGELDAGNPSMVDKAQLLQWVDESVIKYFGFVNDVRPLIAKSDCIVLPSYREGMPRTILEGMSMAKPVITTDVAGCRQTVEANKSGFLVKPRDTNSLKTGMEKFLQLSKHQRLAMGRKGRERAMVNFNSQKIASELYEIISQVYFYS